MNYQINTRLSIFFVLPIMYVLSCGTVQAHARWVIGSITPPRTDSPGLKDNPCGGVVRTTRSTIFSAGQTIEVQFEETVNHNGYFRIAFSPADDLNFDSYVIVPNIPDTTNTGVYKHQITLPLEPCATCTLQLIQYMVTSTSTSNYYSCSDIQITSTGDMTKPAPVTNINASAGSNAGQAALLWTNPTTDFYKVVVLKGNSPIFDEPVDGDEYTVGDKINQSEVVYVGNANTFIASSLTLNDTYYFKVFSQNPRKNYAAGVETTFEVTATVNTGTTNTPSNDSSGGNTGPLTLLFAVLLVSLRRIYRRHIRR